MNKQKLSEIHKRTWTPFFEAILRGDKNGEVRLNDFDVQSGDTLVLDEWNPNTGYTGRSIKRKVRAVFPVDFHQFHTDEEIREHGHLYIELENPRIAEAEKLALALDSPDGLLVNGMKRIIPELSKMLLKALHGVNVCETCIHFEKMEKLEYAWCPHKGDFLYENHLVCGDYIKRGVGGDKHE